MVNLKATARLDQVTDNLNLTTEESSKSLCALAPHAESSRSIVSFTDYAISV